MATDEQIVAAALEWERWRQDMQRLLAERNGTMLCKREYGKAIGLDESSVPCWRIYAGTCNPDGNGGTRRLPQSEWCDACRERERIHLEYVDARKNHGIAMRRLRALLRARLEDK